MELLRWSEDEKALLLMWYEENKAEPIQETYTPKELLAILPGRSSGAIYQKLKFILRGRRKGKLLEERKKIKPLEEKIVGRRLWSKEEQNKLEDYINSHPDIRILERGLPPVLMSLLPDRSNQAIYDKAKLYKRYREKENIKESPPNSIPTALPRDQNQQEMQNLPDNLSRTQGEIKQFPPPLEGSYAEHIRSKDFMKIFNTFLQDLFLAGHDELRRVNKEQRDKISLLTEENDDMKTLLRKLTKLREAAELFKL